MSESRFQHLLQPIRDLSQNWNIDLAQELEEYLGELENLSIAFDPSDEGAASAFRARSGREEGDDEEEEEGTAAGGGGRVMNFAEAALLIQGTSVIYSRKVEYLYALVFQTLAHLSKQQEDKHKRQIEPRPEGEDGGGEPTGDAGDSDGEDGNGGDLMRNALPIYDVLDEAREVQIHVRKPANIAARDAQEYKKRHDLGLSRSKNNLQASVALMGSLVPGERDHGDAFKLMSCNLHVSGVMLLDEGSRRFLEEETDFRYVRGDKTPRRASLGRVDWDLGDGDNPATTLNFDDVGDGNDADDGDDAGGYEPADFGGYDNPEDEPGVDGGDAEQYNDQPGDLGAAEEREDNTFSAIPATSVTTRSQKRVGFPRAAVAERDPWAPLDPYDATGSTSRPFRKGRSYPRRPPYKKRQAAKLNNKDGAAGVVEEAVDGLDDPDFKDRFFRSTSKPQWSSWVWSETSETALEKKFKKKFGKAQLLVKSADELWKSESKWKSLVRRSEAKEEQSAQALLLQEEAEEEEQEMHEMNLARSDAPLDMHFDGGDGGNAADDAAGDDDADDYDDGGGPDFDWGGGSGDNAADKYSDAVDAAAYLSFNNGDRPLTYEEICRQHIETFMKGAEQYVRETDLTKQVNEWQTKLTPLLKEQDERPPFDIQHYGREIIVHLKKEHRMSVSSTVPGNKRQKRTSDSEEDDPADIVPFDRLAGGKNSYEVCRMFLASLQLANNGNVELVHGKTAAEQGHVPFQMQLLTSTNVYESIQ